jgi:hypothetical protein
MVLAYLLLSLASARLYTNNRGPNFGEKATGKVTSEATTCDNTVAGVPGCSGEIPIGNNGS